MAEPISHHEAHRRAYGSGSLAIGSESAQPTSYYPTPRGSTLGGRHFYARFRGFAHHLATDLGLASDPTRATNSHPQSARLPDRAPPEHAKTLSLCASPPRVELTASPGFSVSLRVGPKAPAPPGLPGSDPRLLFNWQVKSVPTVGSPIRSSPYVENT